MDFLSKNLSRISEDNPGLERLLEEAGADGDLVPEPTPTGLPTLRYRGRYVHSRRDPRAEARRFAERIEAANCFVLLGFGLGYQCEAMLERFPNASLLVVLKHPGRLRGALEARDLTGVLKDSRVQFLLGPRPDEMALFLSPYEHGTIQTVSLLGVAKDDDYFVSIARAVAAYLERRTINLNTLRRFGRRWVRNLVENLPEIGGALGVERASDAFAGVPALVLAAGPSLDQVLPYVRTLARRCLVIAVDTALPRLAAVNLEPDIAVIVDPQYWNSRHLDRMFFDRAVLVSESSTHPRVFRSFSSKPLLSSSLFPLGAYVERFLGGFGRLGAGGSVTTTAWDLARVLGCGPILLGGMDLGFPDRRTHCRGSFFEERAHTLGTRMLPAEQRAFAYLRDAGPFPAPANDGTLVTTDRRMQLYRWWFENQARIYPETDTVNLSPGGVALDGIPYRPAEDFVSLPDRRPEIDPVLSSLRQPRESVSGISGSLGEGLEALLRELSDLERDLGRTLTILDGQAPDEPMPDSRVRELEEIDRRILANPNREIVAFLALDEAQAVVALASSPDSPPDTAEEAHRRAVDLYTSLLKSVRYHSDALRGAVRAYSAR